MKVGATSKFPDGRKGTRLLSEHIPSIHGGHFQSKMCAQKQNPGFMLCFGG